VLDAKDELVIVSNDDYIAVHRRWLSLRDDRCWSGRLSMINNYRDN